MWITAYWSWLRMLLGPAPVVVSLDEARPNDCSSDVLVEQSLKKEKHKLIGDQRIVNIYLFSSETSASSLATRSSSAATMVSSSNLQQ